jgi:hypothetical protein
VLTDLAYPGWVAEIDGAPAEWFPFDERFRAVDLSAGRHLVVWRFHPRSVVVGAWISAGSLLALALLSGLRRAPRRPAC